MPEAGNAMEGVVYNHVHKTPEHILIHKEFEAVIILNWGRSNNKC